MAGKDEIRQTNRVRGVPRDGSGPANRHLPGVADRPLAGKRINVGRVTLYECQTCCHLMPTPAGQAKVDRNVNIGIKLFLGQLP